MTPADLADWEVEGDVVLGAGVIGHIRKLSPLLTGDAPYIYMPRHKHSVCSVNVEAQQAGCVYQCIGFIVCEP